MDIKQIYAKDIQIIFSASDDEIDNLRKDSILGRHLIAVDGISDKFSEFYFSNLEITGNVISMSLRMRDVFDADGKFVRS